MIFWRFHLIILLLAFLAPPRAIADEILVSGNDFNKIMADAKAGDVFSIPPGDYTIGKPVELKANGTLNAPITIKPTPLGKVNLHVTGRIGFKITGANWIIEGLNIYGGCGSNHGRCEHAIQIAANADFTIIRNNRLIDFNAPIKGNGDIVDGRQLFPDKVLIEGNRIYNREPRRTSNPVTMIDVVGGRAWVVRNNFIADFQKLGGNQISFAAFLKGNSDHGLFERNLVICEWRLKGGTRVGLSFGGGGTSNPDYCQNRSCTIEHYRGVMRGNVIMNCPDVGIYLNNAANTKIVGNTVINTAGVDVRFIGSFAEIANNVIEGRILGRDRGRFSDDGNLVEPSLDDLFPRDEYFDLTPTDIDRLMGALDGFEGVDFCSGEPQGHIRGAIADPQRCSVRDRVIEVLSEEPLP